METKEWLGLLSLLIGVIQYAPYCWSTFKGQIRPHAFSYYIWGLSSAIVFVAQYVEKGGAGSWVMGMSALACFLVGGLSARNGMNYISRGDWIALCVALASIPLWIITSNPLSAVIVLTIIDGSAYIPSVRKAYLHPDEDTPLTYIVGCGKHLFSLFALENYNLTTTLMPLFIVVANAMIIFLLFHRRRALQQTKMDIL